MNNIEKKAELKKTINCVLEKAYIKSNEKVVKELNELLHDIAEDMFTILVLGEFKRGKSTFINSLLKENLLPSDVLPETAVISAIGYNPHAYAEVLYEDGTVIQGEPTLDFLSNFSARGRENIDNVKYIKIGHPADILEKGIVIVDTPGVDDINEQRCEVTYKFLPRAHAVIFLLDANSPMKKTEKDFIDSRLIPLGINNIIFVVNKYDNVDEDEEEDLLEEFKQRIAQAVEQNIDDIKVFPLSAKWALLGAINGDAKYIDASGIEPLKEQILDTAFYGDVETNKLERYQRRFKDIVSSAIVQFENEKALKLVDEGQLKAAQEALKSMFEENYLDKQAICSYVEEEKPTIKAMVEKSLLYFYRRLEDDIITDIRYYKGVDFKDYVEQRVAKSLQRQMENWIASYSPYVDQLIMALEKEISYAISLKFQQKVVLKTNGNGRIGQGSFNFFFQTDDVSSATTKAGVIAAGGAGLMMLIGGSMLMPFISMAAFPYMQKKFLEENLNTAKDRVIPEIQEQLAEYMANIKRNIFAYIDEKCRALVGHSELSFDALLQDVGDRINKELEDKRQQANDIEEQIHKLNVQIKELQNFLEEA